MDIGCDLNDTDSLVFNETCFLSQCILSFINILLDFKTVSIFEQSYTHTHRLLQFLRWVFNLMRSLLNIFVILLNSRRISNVYLWFLTPLIIFHVICILGFIFILFLSPLIALSLFFTKSVTVWIYPCIYQFPYFLWKVISIPFILLRDSFFLSRVFWVLKKSFFSKIVFILPSLLKDSFLQNSSFHCFCLNNLR